MIIVTYPAKLLPPPNNKTFFYVQPPAPNLLTKPVCGDKKKTVCGHKHPYVVDMGHTE